METITEDYVNFEIAKLLKEKGFPISSINFKDCVFCMYDENGSSVFEKDLIEQAPADKVEPKFKVGDWIINNDKRIAVPTQILELEKYGYVTSRGYISFDKVKTDYHLWTIQDAKDGDVLANDHHILILRELGYSWAANGSPDSLYAYCGIKPNENFELEQKGYCFCGPLHTHPATKEQRDLLFQKMKEAGYEWDFEKNKLKKIEQEPYPKTLSKAIELYYYSYGNGKGGFDNLSLEKFKDIVKTFVDDYGIQKPAWSEEDERRYRGLHNLIYSTQYCDSRKELSDWLKSLKDRVQPQLKQEWSEEDERIYKSITYSFAHNCPLTVQQQEFVKSLRPQNKWKPSDEQMNDLKKAIDSFTFETDYLQELYNDLKKLNGE